MSTDVWVLLLAVVGALSFGCYRALTDGRFRGTRGLRGAASSAGPAPTAGPVQQSVQQPGEQPGVQAGEQTRPRSLLAGTPWNDELGERATLLQFSSAFCAPCRATRQILDSVASITPGVAHLEVDAEHHLDVVRRLGILRTPTTVVLGPHGAEVTRATGAPTRQQVLAAIAGVVPEDA